MTAVAVNQFLVGCIRYLLIRFLRVLRCDDPVKSDICLYELVRILACHLYFRYGRRSVFPTYDYQSPDPVLRGYFMRDEEKKLEYPVPHVALEYEGPQELLFTGIRTSGEVLVVRMVRAEQRQAQIQIVLRDAKGRVFLSADQAISVGGARGNASRGACNVLPLDISQGNKFQAGGLRLVCMDPMRKWRIAYNGMMINKETGQAAYVNFAVLWFNFAHVMDWANMVPANRLTNFCLEKGGPNDRLSDTIASIEQCQDHLKGYEQSGYYVGTLKISEVNDNQLSGSAATSGQPGAADGETTCWEQEIHLRGNFVRIRHPQGLAVNPPALNGFSHDFVFSTKGHIAQVSTLNFAQTRRGLVYGSFVGTPGFKDSLEHVLNDQGLEADVQDVLSSPVLQLRTFELSHELLRSERTSLGSFRSVLGWNNELKVSTFDAMIDGIKATGVTVQGVITGMSNDNLVKPPLNVLDFETPFDPTPYVVSLSDSQCKNCDLTGGKGSSLAVLTEISHLTCDRAKFAVPNGVVVTTEAFRRFLQSPKMSAVKNDIRKVLSTRTVEEVKLISDDCKQRVQDEPIPSCISGEILAQLYKVFPDLASKRFAVRSSCAGEDSEDMSAAGQMDTFLGVKGEKEIITAIVKCWSSQFGHVAVEYKRRYGQELVSEMAVVVMEMVPADSAGVLFTCDPLTGDPSTIYITSNFGLGESVVSALADPDTVRVSRDINGTIAVNKVDIGKKDVKIVMDLEAGGMREEKVSSSGNSSATSISVHQAAELARIGAEVERCYGDWRDIEWAIQSDTIFLLQARPVTFMDKPSDEEVSLDMEIPARNENSCFSKANVGEVLHGAVTPLGIDMMSKECGISIRKHKGKSARERRTAMSPYFESFLRVSHCHYFFDLSECFRSFIPDINDVRMVESMMLNLCGRVLDDPMFYSEMNDETDLQSYVPYLDRIEEKIRMKWIARPVWRYNRYLARRKAQFPTSNMSVDELFNGFITAFSMTIDYATRAHMDATNGTSLWTSEIVGYLQSVTDESTVTIYGDMSKLLGSAHDVVSCEVPKALEHLSHVIQSEIGRDNFLNASNDEALALLKDEVTHPLSSDALRQFLEDHGHRGYNEFDVYRRTWGVDTAPVVTTLQALMRNESAGLKHKEVEGVWASANGITCKLSFWQKLRLSVIVYFSRKGVGIRENTKSLWIWTQHVSRLWTWALARKLRDEGRLPNEELFFFCTLSELEKVIKTRDPAVIARAYHRKRLFPKLVDLQFPEYFRGDPKPIEQEAPTFDGDVVQMKGFPISAGRIQARARVINKLEEAHTIQRGEVLITYATDIGWSPYFPLLGGVVTELGGLMSHGAVVAREYGLPCVVGLFGASKVFRTGDLVLLDGANGVLARIEEAQEQTNGFVPGTHTGATATTTIVH